ncbi:sulfurtransferase TusA family protein [Oculatella sp. FACHB-28]|uniref:sulfurtransferase TusA family protein n=1 Tax=Cyanophyceae TaxID=3028117 RepID=UPI0016846ECD|nr:MULTISPECIES: sulfurtransferase TusA family protein [Cyanophyceae]MBD2056472.1 sulfurtransferase TusA family protein [Oculatella sp. FACHB-28]MBD2070437.1 sulfurtransferase TusA family protein [Leptolyngbya sp. FACHB-671]
MSSAASTAEHLPDAQLDLRGTPCPINFVKTKLRLEKMAPGALLEVWLDPGEPMEQVPDSLTMEGYGIEQVEERAGFFAIRVRRPSEKSSEC